MSGINDYKITDTSGYKVADVPGDTLSGTTEENKEVFDKLGELIISHFNNVVDYLKNKNVDNSYTAKTGKPTSDATLDYGDSFTVSQIVTDNSGRVTDAVDRTITLPDALATTSSAGLMSAEDKIKMDGISGNTIEIKGTFSVGDQYTHSGSTSILASTYGLTDWSNWTIASVEAKASSSSGGYLEPRVMIFNGTVESRLTPSASISANHNAISVYISKGSTGAQNYDYRVVVMQVASEE